jgi:SpoVK/Ycf46/Vps4 family AAA+-type ATPase
VELARLGGADIAEVEETAIRLARMMRLTGRPLIVDATASDDHREHDDWVRTFLSIIGRSRSSAAVVTRRAPRIVRLLGAASCEIEAAPPGALDRITLTRIAAAAASSNLNRETAEAIASKHPLQIDQLDQAMRLARATARAEGLDQFAAACREVSAEAASHLADRIEPLFKLEDVVLPPDKKRQLEEIVDNVRLASKVLDDWKFRAQLPYGRGVTALFHGPSGTGKTMAALGVAHALGIQIMRVDLSRIMSKYIGDSEKNIARVFLDAQMSGAALLIDEADALLGKRSEVNDAHDRYANIEVAYLLQRMETYEGLAILTTNLRQNLDAAFPRRLRFIVDFPRPDIEAREKIWRQCLPDDSHELDEAAFRQLARKIDLTGGHVRQITLRAAFVAAAADSKIGIEHIAHATRAEFAKLGLPSVELDVAQKRRAA